MKSLRYTLIADGSSDVALMPIIDWLLAQHRPDLGIVGELARDTGKVGLALDARVPAVLKLFPCDILFVHRDAEGDAPEMRFYEISHAVDDLHKNCVPIVPLRMTEAWLFSDEAAIRSAAENRSGKISLNLPAKKNWEGLKDPKQLLFNKLIIASEKTGRALSKFNPARQRMLITQRTTDFSDLRGVASFDAFEEKLIEKLKGF